MTTTLGYAVLGLLARRPHSGYEVAARMRTPIGYFWTASHAQIHGTLSKLVEAGLAAYTTEPGPGPYDKKMYTLTPAGRTELARWAASPPPAPQPRNEMLLRVYNGWLADPAAVVAMLDGEIARHRDTLGTYQELRAAFDANGTPDDPRSVRFADYATLLAGIGSEREELRWLKWLRDTLRAASDSDGAG
ncbi:PadR family transcriptional regulator [Actinocatenispora rupis]|uniref:PadR family transcriptional regulator n=1 Tax=Actinocatenispora rupis TaxID=519421 RepID=A0A8J3J6J0_9ACTN|nr:PadR family transcriptional regulator [Actinocatenispora rupis]GID12872.1 PadR family transcriptional regulator [Actinocatenispora rupis]